MYEPLRLATQPLTLVLFALALVTLVGVRRSARPVWRWAALLLALLTIAVCHPYVAWAAARTLEGQYPPSTARGPVRALVVLSGGLFTGLHNEGTLAEDSLVRTVFAAQAARELHPDVIVVTGGVVNPSTSASAAQRMKDLLVVMGVPEAQVLVEPRAMTTVGNARESKALLAPRGLQRIGLVTDALHMPRAVGIFRAEGFDVIPIPCQFQAPLQFPWSLSSLVPGPRAAWLFNRATHEWISMIYYRARGAWR